jgi:hypothetical protein
MSFTLTHSGQSVAFSMTPSDIRVDSAPLKLRCRSGDTLAEIDLSPELLKQLGLQCLALMPDLEPRMAVPSLEEACRIPAYALKLLDDREIQYLLRECQSDTLECLLWYMKDGDLLSLIVKNMSQRAAEMLMEDLSTRWRGRDPDKATESKARLGREAVGEIMKIAHRMRDEGYISELLEYGPAPERPAAAKDASDFLTSEEDDALLKGGTDD